MCAAPLGAGPGRRHFSAMSRTLIATIAGLAGFFVYVLLVLLVADHVRALHWTVELLFFAVAGVAWVWPARALMVWAVRGGG